MTRYQKVRTILTALPFTGWLVDKLDWHQTYRLVRLHDEDAQRFAERV